MGWSGGALSSMLVEAGNSVESDGRLLSPRTPATTFISLGARHNDTSEQKLSPAGAVKTGPAWDSRRLDFFGADPAASFSTEKGAVYALRSAVGGLYWDTSMGGRQHAGFMQSSV